MITAERLRGRRALLGSGAALALGIVGVSLRVPDDSLLRVASVEPRESLTRVDTVEIFIGGYGSALAADPDEPGHFYLLTDRGPNYDAGEGAKAFPAPEFSPRIARFRLEGDALRRVAVIELRDAAGRPLAGLPNPPGRGGSGEAPFDVAGNPLPFDPQGLDPEGLAVMADGSFWVSDEYGPYLVHLDSTGRTIERVGPFEGPRRLPSVLARRRPNRGLEGLTAVRGGRVLVGLMQGPLDNPKSAGRASTSARLLAYDTRTGASWQYVYPLDEPGFIIGDITALSDTTFLVLEGDGRFRGHPKKPSAAKRIYRVSLAGATDVSDPADGPDGRLVNGRTLEELDPAALAAAGIVPVQKHRAADLLSVGYPHDKPEGVALVDDSTVAVSNDDDFGVTDEGGGLAPKILPATGAVDRNEVYFLRVRRP